MSRRSFEAINYSLRPNKNVERKLIVSSLRRLSAQFPIHSYRYIGFGSMWFTDFVLMHKQLGISDMVTMEQQISRQKRVEFNKPFACIDVRMASAASALVDVVTDTPSLIWLDYDGPLKDALTGDPELAIGAMSSGSMIMLSVNAKVEQLAGHIDADKNPIEPIDYLNDITDDTALASQAARLTRNDFPGLVAEILHNRLKAAALSRPGMEYRPIWTFRYADDAEMITVGGMIADDADSARLAACGLDELRFLSPSSPFEIDLPVLTDREKRALDRLMPSAKPLKAKNLDFELRDNEIAAYQEFYLEYPIFNELAA